VLAVPGEITSALARGTNHLLRLGAVPVTCLGDALAVLGLDAAPPSPPGPVDPRLGPVEAAVADAAVSADQIARSTGLPAATVAAALAELELAGVVVQSDGLYRGVMRRT